ncbi:hypothetical protein CLOM_g20968 [Closterium sp. NIES-68]|nr:hypothetical protein CLOM_g20968 [Closterium sp. NIES-68]
MFHVDRIGWFGSKNHGTSWTTCWPKGLFDRARPPFAALILFTPKKYGGLRMCIDYRTLNQVKIKYGHRIPRADELIDQLRGVRYFSKIDLPGGYHKIRVFADNCQKTAFRTRYGSYECTIMPFGLTNAPSTFQLTMNGVFWDLLDKCVIIYLDDILTYSMTREQHLKDLEAVFQRLQQNRFITNGSKCEFFKPVFGARFWRRPSANRVRVAKVTIGRAKLFRTRQRNVGDRARVQDLAMLHDRSRRDCMNISQIPPVHASAAESQPAADSLVGLSGVKLHISNHVQEGYQQHC